MYLKITKSYFMDKLKNYVRLLKPPDNWHTTAVVILGVLVGVVITAFQGSSSDTGFQYFG